MQHEALMQQTCGRIKFMIDQINNIPEPDRSHIFQRVVETFNKSLNREYLNFPFVEEVQDD